MKKVLLIAIALITVNATAQEHKRERQRDNQKERFQHLEDFSPEEIATLQTKKMALQLDLTESQQKEIKAIHLEQAKARKTEMEARKKMREENKEVKPLKEDRFNRANSQLDKQLASKAKMKSILSKEQFEKFERTAAKRGKQKTMKRKKQGGKQKMTQKRKRRN